MKRKHLLIFPLLLAGLFLLSPTTITNHMSTLLQQIRDGIRQHVAQAPDEKVYLHFDRPFYEPGDDLWFKAYITDAQNKPSAQSEVLYAELIDPKGNVAQSRRLIVRNGGVAGEFKLGDEAAGGLYKVRAYTRWQQNWGDERYFEKDVQVQAVVLPRLLMKLDFERKAYGAGDLVVATVDLATVENKALADYGFRFVCQLNGEQLTAGSSKTDKEGNALVQFKLPAKLKTNDGLLNVLIDYEGSTESISRSVPIVLNHIDLQFFPEGGDLISGVQSRVGFKALNEFGKPADISGVVLDAAGNELSTFSSFHQGMGAFSLTPAKGAAYRVKITQPKGVSQVYTIPEALSAGYALGVENQSDGEIRFRVHAGVARPMVLVGVVGEKLFYAQELQAGKGERTVSVSLQDFPQGVARFTLFDYNKVERCERLVFVNRGKQLNINITTDKEKYLPREKVEMTIDVSDADGLPMPANLSMAVVDDKLISFADDKQDNILSHMLLSTEVKGEVEEPSFYFKTDEPKAAQALDYLLMTQGWRRFSWEEVLDGAATELAAKRIQAEKTVLRGRVIRDFGNAPAQYVKVKVLETEQETKTDAEGYFEFSDLDLTEPKTLIARPDGKHVRVLQVADYKGNYEIGGDLKGVVRDADSGQPLIGANVFIPNTKIGAVTDVEGRFSIKPPVYSSEQELQVSYIGYQNVRYKWKGEPELQLDLEPADELMVMEVAVADAPGMFRGKREVKLKERAVFFEDEAVPQEMMVDDQEEVVKVDMEMLDDDKNIRNERNMLVAEDVLRKPAPPALGKMQLDSIAGRKDRWVEQKREAPVVQGLYLITDQMPEPPGGIKRYLNEVEKKAQGTTESLAKGKKGRVLVQVTVDKTGKLEDATVLSGLETAQNEAALEAIREAGQWKPATEQGQAVRVRTVIPVRFTAKSAEPEAFMYQFGQQSEYAVKAEQAKFQRSREFYAPTYQSSQPIRERSDFRNTVFWEPNLTVDRTGTTTVTFYNNDAVSSFRATVEGIGQQGFLGRQEYTYYSQLPISISAKVPPVFAFEDQINLPITVKNNSTETVKARFAWKLPKHIKLLSQKFPADLQLKAGEAKTFYANGEILPILGEGKIKLSVAANGFYDAVEQSIQVVPNGFEASVSFSDKILQADYTLEVTDLVDRSQVATLTAYPDALSDLMAGIESILREPYGCFEQTSMTAYPNILALQYMEEAEVIDPVIRKRAMGLIERGYAKLTSFETSKKGYEWFGQAPAHEGLTAYGLMEFVDMQKVYSKVDQGMIDRTAKWIASRKDGKGGFQMNSRALDSFGRASKEVNNAYVVYALSEAGFEDIVPELEAAEQEAIKSKDMYRLGCVTIALYNLGKTKRGDQTLELLMEQVAKQQFSGLAADHSITRSGGKSLQVETASLVVMAMLKAPKVDYETLREGVKFLMQSRAGMGGFGSTQATILALKALTAYATDAKQTKDSGTIEVWVDGKKVAEHDYEAGVREPIQLKGLGRWIKEGNQTVSVRFSKTKAALPYSLDVAWSTRTPTDDPECVLSLESKLGSKEVSVGETARLTTVIRNKTDQGQPMTMALVGIPSGMSAQPWQLKELQEQEKVDFYEVRENYVFLYFRDLAPDETHTIHLDLKAEVPGDYVLPSSSAYLYYTSEYKDWEGGQRIAINK